LTIIYKDGTQEMVSRNIGVWSNNGIRSDHRKTLTLTFRAKSPVRELVLGDGYDVDVNPGNNHWRPG